MKNVLQLDILAIGALAAIASAQQLNEDFESSTIGSMPNAPWQDVTTRIDTPTTPTPTGKVVATTDHNGDPTQAFQINDEFGTSQGILAEIGNSQSHQLSSSVRIDRLADDRGWPIAAGFIGQTAGATDFNQGVQCVIYADREFQWHLFVKKGLSVGQDQIIPGTNWQLGQWYDLDIAFDVQTGALDASITNLSTGQVEASKSRFVTAWKDNAEIFDAVAFFDGEYATGDKHGADFMVDNVVYTPSPASAAPVIGTALLLTRRRRA